jgi:hypothetical protein
MAAKPCYYCDGTTLRHSGGCPIPELAKEAAEAAVSSSAAYEKTQPQAQSLVKHLGLGPGGVSFGYPYTVSDE